MIASGSYASSCTWLALILAPLFQDAREEAMDAIKRRDFVLRRMTLTQPPKGVRGLTNDDRVKSSNPGAANAGKQGVSFILEKAKQIRMAMQGSDSDEDEDDDWD